MVVMIRPGYAYYLYWVPKSFGSTKTHVVGGAFGIGGGDGGGGAGDGDVGGAGGGGGG